MTAIDFGILDFIQAHMRGAFGDAVLPIITKLGDAGIFWILLALVLILIPRFRKLGFTMAAALVVDVLCCNIILKPLVARIRPCDVNTAVELLVSRPHDFSFPSGHAAASFAATFALVFRRSKLWIPACILAVLISFSRLYLYVHYPSDILAGVVVGLLAGYLGYVITELIYKKRAGMHRA